MLMMEPALLGIDKPPRHRLRDEIGRAHVEAEDEIEIVDLHIDKRRWAD